MLTPDRIIAGAQFVGTWEERINNIVDEMSQNAPYPRTCPICRGCWKWGAGPKVMRTSRWRSSRILPAEKSIMIGEASPERLAMGENVGPSFVNLFRRVEICGLGEDETLSLLSNVARDLERDLNIRVQPDAIQASVHSAAASGRTAPSLARRSACWKKPPPISTARESNRRLRPARGQSAAAHPHARASGGRT